ncbi:MAG: hypothetical protein KME49_22660 [Brasilonema octagenarum HA4186-MV1]|jgi:serine/threonine protein kinase|nr:hypothetical protein [Brasilonema octagenarum HA4186-MV1]
MADYINAIKRPDIAFKGLRPDLVAGKPVLNKQGKPRAARGGFGCVLKFETFSPHEIWAIKCYNVLPPDLEEHYQKVERYLSTSVIANYFLEISFSRAGIRCDGKVYPILKMEWAKGKDLRTFLGKNLDDSYKLKSLAEEWLKLCQLLTQHGVAHGDLQHENIHVIEENGKISIKLIDYDSLYLTSTGKDVKDVIKGVEGYQHPQRQKINKRCIQIDYFSHLVIYINILAFTEDASLWQSLSLDAEEKKDNLLFSLKDFENPQSSGIFNILSSRFSPEIAKLVDSLEKMCQIDIHLIPDLSKVTGNSFSVVPQGVKAGQRNTDIFGVNRQPGQKVTWRRKPPSKLPLSSPVPDTTSPRKSWKPKTKKVSKKPQPISQVIPTLPSKYPSIKAPFQASRNSQVISSKWQYFLLIFVATVGLLVVGFQGVSIIFNGAYNIVSIIGSVTDDSNEEAIGVKQWNKGKVYKNTIFLRKKYIEEFQTKRSMRFWVEYPLNHPLRKSKDGSVYVKYVRLWKYTGGTSPKPDDYAGSISDATIVPNEVVGSFTELPTKDKQAWLVRLSLDEVPVQMFD